MLLAKDLNIVPLAKDLRLAMAHPVLTGALQRDVASVRIRPSSFF